MTYENAAQTKLIATNCICCGRPLCDAESVESGVGPICAKKYGFSKQDREADFRTALENAKQGDCAQPVWDAMPKQDARRACNAVVYMLAAEPDHAKRIYRIETIRALGFVKLADRLEERLLDETGEIQIRTENGFIFVSTMNLSKAAFAGLLESFRAIFGRRWMPETKQNRFPESAKKAVWKALKANAAGCKLVSELGESVIPALAVSSAA